MNALTNALARLHKTKERVVPPVGEPLDWDDEETYGWEAVVESREAHRRRLALRFSPGTVRAQEHDGKPRVRIRV